MLQHVFFSAINGTSWAVLSLGVSRTLIPEKVSQRDLHIIESSPSADVYLLRCLSQYRYSIILIQRGLRFYLLPPGRGLQNTRLPSIIKLKDYADSMILFIFFPHSGSNQYQLVLLTFFFCVSFDPLVFFQIFFLDIFFIFLEFHFSFHFIIIFFIFLYVSAIFHYCSFFSLSFDQRTFSPVLHQCSFIIQVSVSLVTFMSILQFIND